MHNYDIIFLGDSEFTRDLYNHFSGKCNVAFISNACFKKEFSTIYFPKITFLPYGKENDELFGQVCWNDFRFDLFPSRQITQLFLEEIFHDGSSFFSKIINESTKEMDYLNQLVLDNFSNSLLSFLKKNIKNIFKDGKSFFSIFKELPIDKNKKDFIEGLSCFFAPGEKNYFFYKKYLLYSLLCKIPFQIDSKEIPVTLYETSFLKEIKKTSSWQLIFEDKTMETKVIVSTIPPHILSYCQVTHPFKEEDLNIFFHIQFLEDIQKPTGMADELVFVQNDTYWYFLYQENKLSILTNSNIKEIPKKEKVTSILKKFLPYLDNVCDFKVLPHIFKVHEHIFKANRFNKFKNFFFLKNTDFPMYGSDGEMLYRNRLKEILWKKLL